MSSILQVERVKYECTCGEWAPLCRLFFCRHCSEFRCAMCTANEIDCTFCGTCLENVPVGEARARKNRCHQCHQCPICAMTLVANTTGDQVYLSCTTCRWSTYESDIHEQTSSSNWKIHENPYEAELTAVLDQMKNFEQNEKATKDLIKRRLVGSRLSDRFGLQQMYQKKKAAMERPTSLAPEHLPTADLEELPDSFFTQPPDLTKSLPLDARIRQPLCADSAPRPVRMPLKARRVLRCAKCEHNLSKLEYSPSSIVFKIQTFARNFVPDIRLSRETQLSAGGGSCPVFLSISNETAAKADVILIADNDESVPCVECETPVVELSLPSHDDTADLYSSAAEPPAAEFRDGQTSDVIVFRKRHRAGIRLDVKVAENGETNQLCLVLKWKNELTAQQAANSSEWRQTRMRITLGKS